MMEHLTLLKTGRSYLLHRQLIADDEYLHPKPIEKWLCSCEWNGHAYTLVFLPKTGTNHGILYTIYYTIYDI